MDNTGGVVEFLKCSSQRDFNMALLPEQICDQVRRMPEFRYGVNKVTIELDDGRVFNNVQVAWAREIIRVGNHDGIPFDPSRIVKVISEV